MTFVCDESSDSKSFVLRCSETKHDEIIRLPKQYRGLKDPQLLPVILREGRVLVTLDARMAEKNADYIPIPNPGMIVVRLRRPVRPITHKVMEKLIANFKNHFPYWRTFDFSNLHLEICEDCVMVSALPISERKCVVNIANGFLHEFERAVGEVREKPSLPSESFDK